MIIDNCGDYEMGTHSHTKCCQTPIIPKNVVNLNVTVYIYVYANATYH